jgi:hypothetical protein
MEWHRKASDLFTARMRPRQIAEKLGKSPRQVRRVLNAQGRDLTEGQSLPRLGYDHHFFHQIGTEAKAYFLGLLAADGYMLEGNKNQGYRVRLSLVDKSILLRFVEAIGLENPTLQRHWTKGWTLTIASRIMFEELCALGVVPRKSLVLGFCNQVPYELRQHYIRGYFDGDGCASWVKTRVGPRLYLIFAGTFKMLSGIEQHFRLELAVGRKEIYARPNERIRILQYTSQKEIAVIGVYLYRHATYFLQRKFDSVSKILLHSD